MPFWRTYYHLVWATKKREHLITPEIEVRLFPYLINKAAELGVRVFALNGSTDHLHVVGAIPPKRSVAMVVKGLKGASSHDLNQQQLPNHFAWQRGYGVLTLGEKQLKRAVEYVDKQKEHHARQVTNSWLERVDMYDEGPFEMGLLKDVVLPVPHVLREPESVYEIDDPFPF